MFVNAAKRILGLLDAYPIQWDVLVKEIQVLLQGYQQESFDGSAKDNTNALMQDIAQKFVFKACQYLFNQLEQENIFGKEFVNVNDRLAAIQKLLAQVTSMVRFVDRTQMIQLSLSEATKIDLSAAVIELNKTYQRRRLVVAQSQQTQQVAPQDAFLTEYTKLITEAQKVKFLLSDEDLKLASDIHKRIYNLFDSYAKFKKIHFSPVGIQIKQLASLAKNLNEITDGYAQMALAEVRANLALPKNQNFTFAGSWVASSAADTKLEFEDNEAADQYRNEAQQLTDMQIDSAITSLKTLKIALTIDSEEDRTQFKTSVAELVSSCVAVIVAKTKLPEGFEKGWSDFTKRANAFELDLNSNEIHEDLFKIFEEYYRLKQLLVTQEPRFAEFDAYANVFVEVIKKLDEWVDAYLDFVTKNALNIRDYKHPQSSEIIKTLAIFCTVPLYGDRRVEIGNNSGKLLDLVAELKAQSGNVKEARVVSKGHAMAARLITPADPNDVPKLMTDEEVLEVELNASDKEEAAKSARSQGILWAFADGVSVDKTNTLVSPNASVEGVTKTLNVIGSKLATSPEAVPLSDWAFISRQIEDVLSNYNQLQFNLEGNSDAWVTNNKIKSTFINYLNIVIPYAEKLLRDISGQRIAQESKVEVYITAGVMIKAAQKVGKSDVLKSENIEVLNKISALKSQHDDNALKSIVNVVQPSTESLMNIAKATYVSYVPAAELPSQTNTSPSKMKMLDDPKTVAEQIFRDIESTSDLENFHQRIFKWLENVASKKNDLSAEMPTLLELAKKILEQYRGKILAMYRRVTIENSAQGNIALFDSAESEGGRFSEVALKAKEIINGFALDSNELSFGQFTRLESRMVETAKKLVDKYPAVLAKINEKQFSDAFDEIEVILKIAVEYPQIKWNSLPVKKVLEKVLIGIADAIQGELTQAISLNNYRVAQLSISACELAIGKLREISDNSDYLGAIKDTMVGLSDLYGLLDRQVKSAQAYIKKNANAIVLIQKLCELHLPSSSSFDELRKLHQEVVGLNKIYSDLEVAQKTEEFDVANIVANKEKQNTTIDQLLEAALKSFSEAICANLQNLPVGQAFAVTKGLCDLQQTILESFTGVAMLKTTVPADLLKNTLVDLVRKVGQSLLNACAQDELTDQVYEQYVLLRDIPSSLVGNEKIELITGADNAVTKAIASFWSGAKSALETKATKTIREWVDYITERYNKLVMKSSPAAPAVQSPAM